MTDIKMSDVFNEQLPLSDELVCKRLSPSWQMRDYSKHVARAINSHDSLTDQLATAKAQYNELSSFVQSLQLDSVSDDIALEQILAKHKGE